MFIRKSAYRSFTRMITTATLPKTSARTILLMGDSFVDLKRIAYALQKRGHSIIWGETGHLGLDMAEQERPELIICETRLPDLTGIQVCRMIKASSFPETPVALVGKCAHDQGEVSQAYWAGAD